MVRPFPSPRYAVLVVEDDPFILAEAVDIAIDAGFAAYGARDADGAIRLLERHPSIRILFTDIEMPGSMDGLKLAHAVRDRWPPVRFVIVSGRVRPGPAEMPEDGLFFPKPYDPAAVAQALARIGAEIRH